MSGPRTMVFYLIFGAPGGCVDETVKSLGEYGSSVHRVVIPPGFVKEGGSSRGVLVGWICNCRFHSRQCRSRCRSSRSF